SLKTERHGPGGPAGLQNRSGRATHGSVGSTPAPLRSSSFPAHRPLSPASHASATALAWPQCAENGPDRRVWTIAQTIARLQRGYAHVRDAGAPTSCGCRRTASAPTAL